jgi:integrase
MAKPFKHPNNATHWYANIGRGKTRRLVNLRVPLSEPIEVAQAKLDELTQPAKPQPGKLTRVRLAPLLEEYKAIKNGHYKGKRRGFDAIAARLDKIVQGCGFVYVADIDGKRVMEFIRSLQGPRFGPNTSEHYRTDFASFCTWLIAEGHLQRKPFNRRDTFRGKLHWRRRVLTPAEQDRLLDATGRSTKRVRRIDGPTRRLIYWTALTSGYRNNELRSLTVSSLQGDRLKLSGEFCKNGIDSDQPLTKPLAKALREYTAGRAPEEPLFPRWHRGVNLLRPDLKAAGIPFKTIDGVADFHALRHSFCTDLFAAGVDAKTAHVLMRHKSIDQTMIYAKTDDARKVDAIGRLDRAAFPEVTIPADAFPPLDLPEIQRSESDLERLQRLCGADNLDDLELLGKVVIDANGDVVLAFGPCAGTVLGTVADEPFNQEFNQPAIDASCDSQTASVTSHSESSSAPRRPPREWWFARPG